MALVLLSSLFWLPLGFIGSVRREEILKRQNRSKQSSTKKTRKEIVTTKGIVIILCLLTNVGLESQRLLMMACWFKVFSILIKRYLNSHPAHQATTRRSREGM